VGRHDRGIRQELCLLLQHGRDRQQRRQRADGGVGVGASAGGLITRTVRDGPPVTVTYELTERGRALMPALDQIAQWARDNLPPDAC
jgi:hypothetical protein